MKIVILGLSITSSWGNGHATTYRGLVRALAARGHDVTFLERDQPWYAANRDLANPPYARTEIYEDLADLNRRFKPRVQSADLVIVGSYVPDGVQVGEWVTSQARGVAAFYDIDTPVTLVKLDRNDTQYLSRALVRRYDLYLSFTGGPTLTKLEKQYGANKARVLYCSVDPSYYYPDQQSVQWDLGYLGTYSEDRQPTLERLMIEPSRRWPEARFCIAGSLYPDSIVLPRNVDRIQHLPPADHRDFYNRQRWALNVTRADMVRAGYSPSVRLFEAAACGTPIISDEWDGLDEAFEIGQEILVARDSDKALDLLHNISDAQRREIGARARIRVLAEHTAERRAAQLESYVEELVGSEILSRAAV